MNVSRTMSESALRETRGVHERPTESQVHDAVRTLIRWAGDDPEREGLLDTPARVARAYGEFFQGYTQDPEEILQTTFEEVEGYDEMVCVRDIPMISHCEHHMVPFMGKAHVAYLPDKRVVGLSKLARVVDLYSRRLQIQEKLTVQVADAIQRVLQPKGVAVVIEAEHHCMTTRGIHTHDTVMHTKHLSGVFREDSNLRREFFDALR